MSDALRFRIDAAGDAPDRVLVVQSEAVVYLAIASANGTWDTGTEVAEATVRNLRSRLAGQAMSDAIGELLVAHRDAYQSEAVPHNGSGAIDLMLARLTPTTVDLAWGGADRAYLVRDGAIVRHARPHCEGEATVSATRPRELVYAEHPFYPRMRTRNFGAHVHAVPERQPDLERLNEPWPFLSGDVFVITNDRTWLMLSDVELMRLLQHDRPAHAIVDASRGRWESAAIVVQRV